MTDALKRLVPVAPAEGTSPLAPREGIDHLPAIAGVRFAAAEANVRYANRLDVMLAEIAPGSAMAGVFTRSATRAAPVLWCEKALAAQHDPTKPFALLVNAGNANAFTGTHGEDAVSQLVGEVSYHLGCPTTHIFPASTGVIGEPLPAERITAKLEELVARLSANEGYAAAEAIRTTDTYVKGASLDLMLDGTSIRIGGFAKGSGMISPDMATMLVYLFTDATIAQPVLQAVVSKLNARTFNAITVDGDTSTSDTLVMGATGHADMSPISAADDPRLVDFEHALETVMLDLAHQVVRDGEGATKFVTIVVEGAVNEGSAKRIGLSIANSPLVKTAIAGSDPNWGRIVMAIGKAGEPADRDKITIRFGDVLVAEKGWVSPQYSEDQGGDIFATDEINIRVGLGIGAGTATVWTCDLTHGYITINADYRS